MLEQLEETMNKNNAELKKAKNSVSKEALEAFDVLCSHMEGKSQLSEKELIDLIHKTVGRNNQYGLNADFPVPPYNERLLRSRLDLKIMEALLQSGANPNIKDSMQGINVLDELFQDKEYGDVVDFEAKVDLLQRYGARLSDMGDEMISFDQPGTSCNPQ